MAPVVVAAVPLGRAGARVPSLANGRLAASGGRLVTAGNTTPSNADDRASLSLPQVGGWWRSVRVQGKGRGAAVLQLTSKYHVSDPDDLLPAPTAAFHLRTRATWHGHNGSALTFTTCTRWLFQEASDASGVAVLEVTVPTGYGASASALQSYVASRAVPNLRRADFHQRKVTFYFEKVGSFGFRFCVRVTVEFDQSVDSFSP